MFNEIKFHRMTQTADYQKICEKVQEIAKETGSFIRNEREKISEEDVELKSVASLVTYVDKTAETKIVEALKKLIPGSGFITEEGTATHLDEKYKWIIDPLDGTTNFIHGLSPHCVSIALMKDDELVVGVIYEIGHSEMFYAWKSSPAFLNGKEIRVSSKENLADTLIGTGFPYYAFDKVNEYNNAMKELMQKTRGLRRFGSAAADLAYVACGRFNGFFEHALHAWDVAAGVLIVKQAGGMVSDFNGGENWLYGGEIVIASKAVFEPFQKIVIKHLGKS